MIDHRLEVEVFQKKLSEHFERRGFDWVKIQHMVQDTFLGAVVKLPDGREVTVSSCWLRSDGHLTLRANGKDLDCGDVT